MTTIIELAADHKSPLHASLIRTASRTLASGSESEADDIVQDTIIDAWSEIEAGREVNQAWLFKRVMRVGISTKRRLQRRKVHEPVHISDITSSISIDKLTEMSCSSSTLTPGQVASLDDIVEQISFLPANQQLLLTHVFVNDLTMAEAAEVMSISYDNARQLYSRATRTIKSVLGVENSTLSQKAA